MCSFWVRERGVLYSEQCAVERVGKGVYCILSNVQLNGWERGVLYFEQCEVSQLGKGVYCILSNVQFLG